MIFDSIYKTLRRELLEAPVVDVGTWHSMDVRGNPALATRELLHARFHYPIPDTTDMLAEDVKPNLPWAEAHFQERVGGKPLNPPPSHELWPWSHAQHQEEGVGQFSHTYPERMWPKKAACAPGCEPCLHPLEGIRFAYGDLADVVNLLEKQIYTRQAWLPIWFPEDTGVVHGERVPCTLGYHFIVRDEKLHVTYYMRSCDFVRHFRDDVYMAARLAQWMVIQLCHEYEWLGVGELRMEVISLHIMEGDRWKLEQEENEDGKREEPGAGGDQGARAGAGVHLRGGLPDAPEEGRDPAEEVPGGRAPAGGRDEADRDGDRLLPHDRGDAASQVDCRNCGGRVALQIYKGTGFCGQLCKREWDERHQA